MALIGDVYEKNYYVFFNGIVYLCLRYDIRQGKPLRYARFCQIQQHYKNPLSKPDGAFRSDASRIPRESSTKYG